VQLACVISVNRVLFRLF